MATGKKHLLDNNDDELVQVIYTNLVKKKNTKPSDSINNNAKFAGVLVNGLVYHFNASTLFAKEPTNNLLNIHAGEYRKHANRHNHTIEYIDSLPDFNLAVDYINGYDYNNFEKVFHSDYARYEEFRIMLTKLEFTNLLGHMDELYPLLNINGVIVTVSARLINLLEPNNKLFDMARMQSRYVYIHFRDRELFTTYFRDYLLGKKSRKETMDLINSIRPGYYAGDDSKYRNYLLAKLEDDIRYYGFDYLK